MLDDDQVGEGSEERANEQSGDPISSGRMGGDFVDDDGAAEEVTFGHEQSRCTRE